MTQRVDDKTISNEDLLWRRIANVPQLIKPLPGGTYRVSSAAFKDGADGEVSVHLARLTIQEKALADHPEKGLVEIAARLPRSLGHIVVSDPEIDDPSHALICPPKNQSSKTRLRDARKSECSDIVRAVQALKKAWQIQVGSNLLPYAPAILSSQDHQI